MKRSKMTSAFGRVRNEVWIIQCTQSSTFELLRDYLSNFAGKGCFFMWWANWIELQGKQIAEAQSLPQQLFSSGIPCIFRTLRLRGASNTLADWRTGTQIFNVLMQSAVDIINAKFPGSTASAIWPKKSRLLYIKNFVMIYMQPQLRALSKQTDFLFSPVCLE